MLVFENVVPILKCFWFFNERSVISTFCHFLIQRKGKGRKTSLVIIAHENLTKMNFSDQDKLSCSHADLSHPEENE